MKNETKRANTLRATVNVVVLLLSLSARAELHYCKDNPEQPCLYTKEEINQSYDDYKVQQLEEDERLMRLRGNSDQHIYIHNGSERTETPRATVKRPAAVAPKFDPSQPFERVNEDGSPTEDGEKTHAAPSAETNEEPS